MVEGLHPLVEKLFRERFGQFTPPQLAAMPKILAGENVLLIAPTGSGKTEAALIPVLSGIVNMGREKKGIKALYITPLRALNRDMLERISWWSARLDIRVAVRHGDTSDLERVGQSRLPPDLLITTPETLQAILTGKVLMAAMSSLKWVIVDEVHELASSKRGAQLSVGLERLRAAVGDFQVIGLSATVGTPEEVGKYLVGSRKISIVRADADKKYEVRVAYPVPGSDDEALASKLFTLPDVAARLRFMRRIMESASTVLLFTNTRSVAETLTNRFRMWDQTLPIAVHHGSLARSSRLGVERAMKEGSLRGIICTSSLELGIDVGSVDLVIQYNSPRQVTRLVQRVGRAGHSLSAVSRGHIITMDEDDTLEALVITRRLMAGELEPIKALSAPLDVLMHQLVGLLIWKRKWKVSEMLDFFRLSYPFRDLSEEDLRAVINYVSTRRPRLAYYSKVDDSIVKPANRAAFYSYYFDNLSMIPEEKQYLVIDESEGKQEPVGVLDEAFVSENGAPGVKFVEMGSVWEITQVYEQKVYVKKASDPLGAIPSWEGEEIPVPKEIAQEVGQIRRMAEEKLKAGMKVEDVAEELWRYYPYAERDDLMRSISDVQDEVAQRLPVGTDRRLLIEVWRDYAIFHTHAGLLENRCLARVFAHIFSKKSGLTIQVAQDPYRWAIRLPEGALDPQETLKLSQDIVSDMAKLDKNTFMELAKEALASTGLYKRRLVNAGKKMAAIAKDADLSSVGLEEIIAQLRGSVIDVQAMRDVFTFDVSVDGALDFLKDISEGKRTVNGVIVSEPTHQALNFLEQGMRKEDVVAPERLKRLLEASVRQRLFFEPVTLACTACGQYVETKAAADLPDFPSCPYCGSRRLGITKLGEEAVWIALTSEGTRDHRLYSELKASADLVEKYGRKAIVALAGRGISASEAQKILSSSSSYDEIVRAVMKAERDSLRRRFLAQKR
ncbi:MAG: DEAD/DEAH box helicase [Thermoprotei archaeon]